MSRFLLLAPLAVWLSACANPSTEQASVLNERTACSDIGFHRATPGFNQCVADLEASLDAEQDLPAR